MGDDHEDNEKLEGTPDFKVDGDRKCTDVLFILLLVLTWCAMTFLGLIVTGVIADDSLPAGNPARLLNGIDYAGRICGVSAGVEDKSKLYYIGTQGVCVETCPEIENYEEFICIDSVMPDVYNNVTLVYDTTEGYTQMAAGNCLVKLNTTDILNYCVLNEALDTAENSALNMAVSANVNTTFNGTVSEGASDWFDEFTADLFTAKYLIMGFGVFFAMVMGFAFLLFMRIPGVLAFIIWALVGSILVLFLAGGTMLISTAGSWANEEEPKSHSDTAIQGCEYLGYALYGCAFLHMCLMLWLRKRILLAIGITKEAARAVNAMKLIMLFPVIQSLGLLFFLVPWFIYTIYLASAGNIEAGTYNGLPIKVFTYDDNMRYAGLFLLFCYYWTSEFIVALGQIIVAMSVSMWYFCRDKGEIGNQTVVRSVKVSSFYHCGTAAFGSLIIAIIKTIRAIVAYFQKKAKDSKNKIIQMILCCVQCCLWCLEKCMKFLNKNAYIQTAMFGYSFCKAARKAFFLITRNILRVAAVSMVSEVVCILGKVMIPLATAFIFYLAADASMADSLHGLIGITIVVWILSMFVAKMFTGVFGVAISTILMCFIADEEMFPPEDRYGEGGLTNTIEQTNKDVQATHGKGKIAPAEEGEKLEA